MVVVVVVVVVVVCEYKAVTAANQHAMKSMGEWR
jgi:hypothetical protein